MQNRKRVSEIGKLYRRFHRYFGQRILDIGCGGGVLGSIVASEGHNYTGIDSNPDMIQAAKKTSDEYGLDCRFILGDATRMRVRGKFDTFTSLGNGLCHLSTHDLVSILDNVKDDSRRGSNFILEYRDVVEMLFDKHWARRYVLKRNGHKLISETTRGDFEQGKLVLSSHRNGEKNKTMFTHSIWSPFIMKLIMNSHDWHLVTKTHRPESYVWVEVYRK